MGPSISWGSVRVTWRTLMACVEFVRAYRTILTHARKERLMQINELALGVAESRSRLADVRRNESAHRGGWALGSIGRPFARRVS
jgi:hypothetical protein